MTATTEMAMVNPNVKMIALGHHPGQAGRGPEGNSQNDQDRQMTMYDAVFLLWLLARQPANRPVEATNRCNKLTAVAAFSHDCEAFLNFPVPENFFQMRTDLKK